MATIDEQLEAAFRERYPNIPIDVAREGAAAAGKISSVQQIAGLAVKEVLGRVGRAGESQVLQMFDDKAEARRLIEEHFDEESGAI